MDTLRALELRHSVRAFTQQPIDGDVLKKLQELVAEVNKESGLHVQLVLDRPKVFNVILARIGGFRNAVNYFAMVGDRRDLEKVGYYGEKLVLEAQKLGLNTCWVGGTHGRDPQAYSVGKNERLHIIIAVGYGQTQGDPHKSKDLEKLVKVGKGLSEDPAQWPDWFKAGAEAAQKAPTAVNQQSFLLSLDKKGRVRVKSTGGFMTGIDDGIIKYNFEVGAASKGHKVVWH